MSDHDKAETHLIDKDQTIRRHRRDRRRQGDGLTGKGARGIYLSLCKPFLPKVYTACCFFTLALTANRKPPTLCFGTRHQPPRLFGSTCSSKAYAFRCYQRSQYK